MVAEIAMLMTYESLVGFPTCVPTCLLPPTSSTKKTHHDASASASASASAYASNKPKTHDDDDAPDDDAPKDPVIMSKIETKIKKMEKMKIKRTLHDAEKTDADPDETDAADEHEDPDDDDGPQPPEEKS